MSKRAVAIVVGLGLPVVGIVGNLKGSSPDPEAAASLLISTVGATIGIAAMWCLSYRRDDELVVPSAILGGVLGTTGAWVVIFLLGGGAYAPLRGFGSGLVIGPLLGLAWYGIRGPLEETSG